MASENPKGRKQQQLEQQLEQRKRGEVAAAEATAVPAVTAATAAAVVAAHTAPGMGADPLLVLCWGAMARARPVTRASAPSNAGASASSSSLAMAPPTTPPAAQPCCHSTVLCALPALACQRPLLLAGAAAWIRKQLGTRCGQSACGKGRYALALDTLKLLLL